MSTLARFDPRRVARVAAVLYVVMAVSSGFAFTERSRLIKSGDAATTAENIRSSATVFRAAFVIDLIGVAFFLFTAMAFYVLFEHVNRLVAAALVTLVAVSVAIQCVNLLDHFTALSIATGDAYSSTLGAAGSDAQVMLFADRLQDGFFIAQVFFALWLVPLGYLALTSGYFPKALGVLPMIATVSLLAEVFAYFTSKDLYNSIDSLLGAVSAIGELSFFVWLLVKGVRVPVHEPPRAGEARRPSPRPPVAVG